MPLLPQGATYGHGGSVLPSPLDVWFGTTFIQTRRAAKTGILFKPGFNSDTREFAKQLARLKDPERFTGQYAALRPLVEISRDVMTDIDSRYALDYEQRTGVLHVFRHERDLDLAQSAIALLQRFETPHHMTAPPIARCSPSCSSNCWKTAACSSSLARSDGYSRRRPACRRGARSARERSRRQRLEVSRRGTDWR